MRVAIVGTGAIGGFVGTRLIAAGAEVAFLARGATLDALRRTGLRTYSATGDVAVGPVTASDDPAALGPADAVLFCVKRYDTAAAAAACRPLLKPGTPVISLQNGVGAAEEIASVLGPGRAVGGAAYMTVSMTEPGVVRHTGAFTRLDLGPGEGAAAATIAALREVAANAGIDATVRPDIEVALWRKFVLLAGTSALTALTRQPLGWVRDDPVARTVLHAAVAECAAVAAARKVGLPADAAAETIAGIDRQPAGLKASQLTDLERGRRLELDWTSGAIVRMGRESGVPTPVHATVYAALAPFKGGRVASR
ncbi:MAG: ketopantoate reductase family protein [Rhodospirillaceae bacterium]